MASIEAVACLLESPSSWSDFLTSTKGRIDLTTADLRNRDLSDRIFKFCNMDGADLRDCNLDNCKFHNTTLRNAAFIRSSLVSSEFRNVDLSGALFDHAVFRNALFTNARLERATLTSSNIAESTITSCVITDTEFNSATIENVTFSSCKLKNVSLDFCMLQRCKFPNTDFLSVRLLSSHIKNTSFEQGSLSSFSGRNSEILSCHFKHCEITDMCLTECHASLLSFFGSLLHRIPLKDFDLPNSVMLDVTTVECEWPIQTGTTTIFGTYHPSPMLLGQPVQDIKGVSPILRRSIADAQYLRDTHVAADSLIGRVALRIWGLTCAFGTSLRRLSVFAVLAIFLVAFGILLIDEKVVLVVAEPNILWDNLKIVGAAFFGSSDNQLQETRGQHVLLPAARFLGFLVLGLWIGLAANRLGKLSSE